MATRKYEQRLRAEHAEESRRRVLDAVYERLRVAPEQPLSVDEVARHARVSRSMIYATFGSRAGLLDAFAQDLWARSGLGALTDAVAHDDAREHLRQGVAAATRMFAAERDVYRALFSIAQLDPSSVGATVERMSADRAGGMEHLARRLHEQGLLRIDTTVDEAAHMLWVITSFESFDLLITGRRLSVEEVVDVLIRMAERSVCR